MPTTATRRTRREAAAAASNPEGIVTAIVAVTGVKDHVDDIIIPGAFKRTFQVRRPKLVFHHDWLRFLGRILSVVELMPGDSRLPKTTKDGKPWPREAGAVVSVMQFNMNVQAGREGYEWARFYTESNECEWSVGYKVVPGKASKGRDGIRYIHDLDVFEFSLVLHGAASLSMTLDVKALEQQEQARSAPYWRLVGTPLDQGVIDYFQGKALEGKAAEKMIGSGVMVALYPPADVAEQVAVADGSPAEELHVTLAFLGEAADLSGTPEDLVDVVRGSLGAFEAMTGSMSGTVGGIGQFPGGGDDGPPTYVPVDVPGLSRVREAIVDGIEASPFSAQLSRDHGFTPHMTLGYGLEGVEPVPPTDVTFDSLYVVVGDQRIPVPLAPPEPEVKSAAAAVLEAKGMPAAAGHSAFDAVREAKALLVGDDRKQGYSQRGSGMPGAIGTKPATARKPAVRAAAPKRRTSGGPRSAASGSFDESKHKRAPMGDPAGGQFVAKGSGYESAGRKDEAPIVAKAQAALIKAGFLGKQDGKAGKGDDGMFGDKTEAAVKKWQTSMGYKATGKLSGDQFDELTGESDGKREKDVDSDGSERGSGRRRTSRGRGRDPKDLEQDKDAVGRDKYLADGSKNPEYNAPRGQATVKGPRNRPVPPDPPRDKGKVVRGQPDKTKVARPGSGSAGGKAPERLKRSDPQFGERTASGRKISDGEWAKEHDRRKAALAAEKDPAKRLTRQRALEDAEYVLKKRADRRKGSTPAAAARPRPIGAGKPGPEPSRKPRRPNGRPRREFGQRTSDRSRLQGKSAWDTIGEARSMQTGLEVKYDTSSNASPGKDNWIEQVGGQLDPFIRAVVNALMRERGKTEEEAHAIAIGRMKTWAAGGGDVTEKTRAKAAKALAAWEALKAKAAATPNEGKSMYDLPGSYEQTRDLLRAALHDLFCKPDSGHHVIGSDEGPVKGSENSLPPAGWVSIESTFPTYVICSWEPSDQVDAYGGGAGGRKTFSVPYKMTGGEVVLGKPEEVVLRVIVEDTGADADDETTAAARFADPTAKLLDEATAMVMFGGASGKSAEVIRPAVQRLLDALAVKGLPDVLETAPVDEDDDDPTALFDEPDAVPEDDPTLADDDDPYDELSEVAEDESETETKDLVTLDADLVAAQLASIGAPTTT